MGICCHLSYNLWVLLLFLQFISPVCFSGNEPELGGQSSFSLEGVSWLPPLHKHSEPCFTRGRCWLKKRINEEKGANQRNRDFHYTDFLK